MCMPLWMFKFVTAGEGFMSLKRQRNAPEASLRGHFPFCHSKLKPLLTCGVDWRQCLEEGACPLQSSFHEASAELRNAHFKEYFKQFPARLVSFWVFVVCPTIHSAGVRNVGPKQACRHCTPLTDDGDVNVQSRRSWRCLLNFLKIPSGVRARACRKGDETGGCTLMAKDCNYINQCTNSFSAVHE